MTAERRVIEERKRGCDPLGGIDWRIDFARPILKPS
jgi:hypothetical protein